MLIRSYRFIKKADVNFVIHKLVGEFLRKTEFPIVDPLRPPQADLSSTFTISSCTFRWKRNIRNRACKFRGFYYAQRFFICIPLFKPRNDFYRHRSNRFSNSYHFHLLLAVNLFFAAKYFSLIFTPKNIVY